MIQDRWFWHQGKRVCNFINSNLCHILLLFRDTAGFLLKTAPPITPEFWDAPFGLDCRCWGSEERRPQAKVRNACMDQIYGSGDKCIMTYPHQFGGMAPAPIVPRVYSVLSKTDCCKSTLLRVLWNLKKNVHYITSYQGTSVYTLWTIKMAPF